MEEPQAQIETPSAWREHLKEDHLNLTETHPDFFSVEPQPRDTQRCIPSGLPAPIRVTADFVILEREEERLMQLNRPRIPHIDFENMQIIDDKGSESEFGGMGDL